MVALWVVRQSSWVSTWPLGLQVQPDHPARGYAGPSQSEESHPKGDPPYRGGPLGLHQCVLETLLLSLAWLQAQREDFLRKPSAQRAGSQTSGAQQTHQRSAVWSWGCTEEPWGVQAGLERALEDSHLNCLHARPVGL